MSKWRSKAYLDYIRGLPCAICGGEAEPHHWRKGALAGVGLKPDDCFAIPLCAEHHTLGKDAVHNIGHAAFAERFRIDPWRMIAFLMKDWLGEL